jgi:hypothetical protein
MITKKGFYRPQSLNNGDIYIFRERNYIGERQSSIPITFVDYTPCPAIVIIKFRNGIKQRCLREDIFELRLIEKYQAVGIEFISTFRRYSTLVKSHFTNIYMTIRISLLNPSG